MPSTTTAPDIDTHYPLTREQIAFFREQGYIKLKDVLSPEAIDYYNPIVSKITFDKDPNKGVPMAERDTYSKAFIQVMNIWTCDVQVRALTFSQRLARIATQLLGVTGVRLWHDQALYKEAGGGFSPWHADQYYWPMASMLSVTAWIPLQPVPIEMGSLAFAAGSHLIPGGREIGISDESEQQIAAHIKRHGLTEVYEPFDLGEVSFHYGFTLHRAGPNTTDQPRKVHTIIYMDEDQRLIEPRNANQQQDWQTWTPSSTPGQIMNDALNPVVYSTRQD